MIKDYKKILLTALLDKYECSSFYTHDQQPTRRILLRLYDGGQTDFPEYDIENYEKRQLINRSVLFLEQERLVQCQWMKGEVNHIIAKVWLDYEHLQSAYRFLGRQPKGDIIDEVLLQLIETHDCAHDEWAKKYLDDTISAISRKRSIGNSLPSDKDERADLIRAIAFIEQNKDDEMLERVFSLRCFGDSKRFEKTIRARLVRILKKYLDFDDKCTEEDLLRQIGITRYPEQFEFCGPVTISFQNGFVDFTSMQFGGTVNTDDIRCGQLHIAPHIGRVLSIENRANYIEYIYKHKNTAELVLFHGGQFSPAKRIFLKAVADAIPDNCEFCHWGDIDYGGFSMLTRLRREITSKVYPYRMGEKELVQYAEFAVSFRPEYGIKLASLKQYSELSDCVSCIDYMINHCVKLEQEAMLTDF